MNYLLYFHLGFTVIAAALTYSSFGTSPTLSLLLGALVSFLNLWALVYGWSRILGKKSVAPAIGVIVFKFAILGWILYKAVNHPSIHVAWFAGGLALTCVSVTATALWSSPLAKAESQS